MKRKLVVKNAVEIDNVQKLVGGLTTPISGKHCLACGLNGGTHTGTNFDNPGGDGN